jgi:luciferase-like monooxygenase
LMAKPQGQRMITTFDSLYAGHMERTTSVRAAWLWTAACSRTSAWSPHSPKGRNLAKLLDRRGYDTFWLAEHHFRREGYQCLPNVLLMAPDLAHQTERLKMGHSFNITPMWHPLRLAEDFAAVDVLTALRMISTCSPNNSRLAAWSRKGAPKVLVRSCDQWLTRQRKLDAQELAGPTGPDIYHSCAGVEVRKQLRMKCKGFRA